MKVKISVLVILLSFAALASAQDSIAVNTVSASFSIESIMALWPFMLISVLGAVLHLMGELAESGQGNAGVYWSAHGWAIAKTLLSAAIIPILLSSMDQLNVTAVLMAGYSADSILMKFTSGKS